MIKGHLISNKSIACISYMDLQLSSSQVPQSELYWCCDIEVADDSLDVVQDDAISTILIADSTIGTNRSPILSKTIVLSKWEQ